MGASFVLCYWMLLRDGLSREVIVNSGPEARERNFDQGFGNRDFEVIVVCFRRTWC